MKRLLPMTIAALCLSTPAWAALTVYSHVGNWDVFSGTGTDGRQVCGVGHTNTTNGKAFSLRYTRGTQGITFIAEKPTWHIPEGTTVPVVIQIGLNTPWTEQGEGHGQRVQWTMDPASVQAFDTQFRRAGSMTVTFPSGSEPPWVISLNGSMAASNAMGRCVTAMMQSAPPGNAAAPAAQGPTQPFGTGQAASAQPAASTQPAAGQSAAPTQPAPSR